MKRTLLISVLIICLCVGTGFAEGLQTLIATGRNMGEIENALDEETENYEKVRQAIETGKLQKGAAKDEVAAKYGEPVIANTDTITKREKWAYMPSTSNFFKGPKIYLYFDSNDILDEITVTQ